MNASTAVLPRIFTRVQKMHTIWKGQKKGAHFLLIGGTKVDKRCILEFHTQITLCKARTVNASLGGHPSFQNFIIDFNR